jgi:hypothetical protein
MKKGLVSLILTSLVILSGVGQQVEAAPITYGFSGTVTEVGAPLAGPFPVSATVSGFYTIETGRPDLEPSPVFGRYDVLTDLNFNTTPHLFGYVSSSSSPNLGDVQIVDSTQDSYMVSAYSSRGLTGPSVSGGAAGTFDLNEFRIRLIDNSGRAFRSDALATNVKLEDFDVRSFSVTFSRREGGFNSALGVLTSLTVIPEPSTILLLAWGLAGLALCRQRSFK